MFADALWICRAVAITRPGQERRGYYILEAGRLIALNDAAYGLGTYRIDGRKLFFRTFVAVHDAGAYGAVGAGALPGELVGVGEIDDDGKRIEYVAQLVEQPEVIITGVLEKLADLQRFGRRAHALD